MLKLPQTLMSPPPRPPTVTRIAVPRAHVRPLRSLLEPLLELAVQGEAGDAAAVYLLDSEGRLRQVAQHGFSPSFTRANRACDADGVVGRAWETLEPASAQRMEVRAGEPRLEAGLRAEGFHRAHAFPISSGRRAVGVLLAAGRKGGSAAKGEPLALAAQLVGTAVDWVARMERARQDAAKLATLHEVGRAVAQALDPDAVLRLVVGDAAALLRAPVAGALLFRGREDVLELVAATRGLVDRYGAEVATGDTLAGRAIHTLRPQVENDPARLGDLRGLGGVAAEIRRAVVAPFRIGAEAMGALFVGDPRRGRFGSDDGALLAALAEQAAIAIQNAGLVAELDRKRQESDRLRELARSFQRLDLETLLNEVAAAAHDLSGSQAAIVALGSRGEGLRIEAVVGGPPDLRGRVLSERSGGRWVLDHAEPLVTPDARADDRLDRTVGLPLGAVCFLPIAGPEGPAGVLGVGYDEPRRIPPSLVRLLEALAGHASAAIQNARLFRAVQSGKQEWEEAFDAIGEGIARIDAAGNVARANWAFARFVQRDVRAVIGRSLSDLLEGRVPPSGVHPATLVGDALRAGRSVQAVCSFESPYRVVRAAAYPTATGIALVLRDITAFATLEERHQRILEAVGDAVVITDLGGRLVFANPAASTLFGYEAMDLTGRPISELVPEEAEVFEAMQRHWAETLDGRPQRYEIPILRKDGGRRTAEVSNAPLLEAGRPVGIVAVLRDITEHKGMQARLVQTEKLAALGSLLSGVAHELNNPLASISSFAQLMDDPSVPPGQRDLAREIHAQAERAARIIQHLLTFARLREPRREVMDVASVLDEVLALRGLDLGAGAIELRRDYAPGLVVRGDRHAFLQVFLNLILNAQQAMAERGGPSRLTVRASNQDARVVVEVDDTGPGIPEEHLGRIFDPFFTTKAEGTGTGLGLSVSYGIVQDHGGEITAANLPGGGARLRVALPTPGAAVEPPPVTEPVAAAGSAEAPRPAPAGDAVEVKAEGATVGGLRVLIVDDEPAIRRSLSTFLRRRGHEVEVAGDGGEALRKLLHEDYDAVVCDIRMPGIGGMALFRHLEEQRPEMVRRIVFTTGDVVHGGTHEFLLESGRPFLTKPFDLVELEQRVHTVAAD